MIAVVSGATGGHLYPAISIVTAMKQTSLFFVSRQFPAQQILDSYGIPFVVHHMPRWQWVLFPFILIQTVIKLIKAKPQLVMCMGGRICLPYAVMAWLCRIPVVSFEQNVIPGRATRLNQLFSKTIVTAFDRTTDFLIFKKKVNCLGNPLRTHYPNDSEQIKQLIGTITGNTLVIIGGSQGALGINQWVKKNVDQLLLNQWNIIHLTGSNYFETHGGSDPFKVVNAYGCNYIMIPYLNDIRLLYGCATVALCRAGATTLSELRYYNCPAILVPYPYAMDNHQQLNAEAFITMDPTSKIVSADQLNAISAVELLTPYQSLLSPRFINGFKIDAVKCSATVKICEILQKVLK